VAPVANGCQQLLVCVVLPRRATGGGPDGIPRGCPRCRWSPRPVCDGYRRSPVAPVANTQHRLVPMVFTWHSPWVFVTSCLHYGLDIVRRARCPNHVAFQFVLNRAPEHRVHPSGDPALSSRRAVRRLWPRQVLDSATYGVVDSSDARTVRWTTPASPTSTIWPVRSAARGLLGQCSGRNIVGHTESRIPQQSQTPRGPRYHQPAEFENRLTPTAKVA
jgi:hypothetical protein